MNNTNVFAILLKLLNVKHTRAYSNRLYNEHPHKYNLYGLSEMLSDYNIKNVGIKLDNKEEDIFNLEVPFIAYVGSNFVVISKITSNKIYYIWNGKEIGLDINEFCKFWDGVILIAEPNEQSCEPDYSKNYKQELFSFAQKTILMSAISLLLILTFISNHLYANIGLILLSFVNFTGLYVSYLIVLKQMHIKSGYADKICSLFSQTDCNDVLESGASKIAGLIGWSEIGLAYFTTNTILIFFFPDYITFLALINITTLPYTLWSIGYQKLKAKQWCPLCLIIQVVLWSIFLVNLSFGFIHMPMLHIDQILFVALLYLISVLIISIIIPRLSRADQLEEIKQELNSIKASEDIFTMILKQQPHYSVSLSNSDILFGNYDANILVTILTNPHCNPCSEMHSRVEKLLEQTRHLCIQYIFSSFSTELGSSNKILSSVYLHKPDKKKLFNEWFNRGKSNPVKFIETHQVDIESTAVAEEFEKHKIWQAQAGILETPTILVNGYKLPDNYRIEDLKYIMSI